jgi:hypothetical protein
LPHAQQEWSKGWATPLTAGRLAGIGKAEHPDLRVLVELPGIEPAALPGKMQFTRGFVPAGSDTIPAAVSVSGLTASRAVTYLRELRGTFLRRSRSCPASAWHAWTVTNPNDAAANIRFAINVMAARVVGDDAELSWSKAEDAMRQAQYRQKGRQ